jgi:hypothetical protein
MSVLFQLESTSQARAYLNVLGNEVFRLLKEFSTLAERSAREDGFDRSSPRFWCYINTLSHSVDLGSATEEMHGRKLRLERQLHDFATALLSFNTHGNNKDNRTMLALEIQTILLVVHIVTLSRDA